MRSTQLHIDHNRKIGEEGAEERHELQSTEHNVHTVAAATASTTVVVVTKFESELIKW